jgi:hypothetical protein
MTFCEDFQTKFFTLPIISTNRVPYLLLSASYDRSN